MFWKLLKGLLLGKELKSKDLESEKMGTLWGVPIMASDAVSSVAYAIEEMLLVLVPVLGFAAIGYLEIVASPIILLLLVLVFSYAQVIAHYPNGGGAYVVSAENFGKGASLVAAAALIIDYIMTVAVSLSAATAALIAAFPEMGAHRLVIALALLCVVTLLNLRGMRESSKIFGTPTYAFIAVMAALILTGFVRLATGSLAPLPEQGGMAESPGVVPVFLLFKAFSSGCSALTGVEAVSNAVPSFKEPSQKTARRVLFILVGIMIFIFGGSVLLVSALGVVPADGKTIISQLGSAVFGAGPMFYLLQFVTSLILLLAANTAYNGLPTLLAILAGDGYMPRQFMHRGTRLSFSNGILFILVVAGILLVIFGADTHHLIPLYSIGVFLSFTLSQAGMVARWFRHKERGWRHKMLVNLLGTVMTATGAVIVFSTKFAQGSWMLAIAIPVVCYFMYRVNRHYEFVAEQLKMDNFMSHYHKSVSADKNLCIVLVGDMNRSALKALNYANLISSNVVALNISTDDAFSERLAEKWNGSGIDLPLEVVQTPYRSLIEPIESYIRGKESNLAPGDTITVVMARFMEEHFLANFLHNQTAYFIMNKLRAHRNVATVLVPYIYSTREPRQRN